MTSSTASASSLLLQEAEADMYYGFPSGTMEALGNSESSNGINLGSIGNIFQVTPSTAAQPGYGLSSVNGNSPMSVGAYLSALINGPGGGSVSNGLALYQGRPVGSSGNNAIQTFLGSLFGQPLAGLPQGIGPSTSSSNGTGSTLTDIALQVAVVVLAIILIGIGLAALALKSDPAAVVNRVVKKVTP